MKRDPSIVQLQPFWLYYGGKWRVAHRYPPPQHATLIEPFAGAAGYATRHHYANVHLYDVNPVIAGVWAYLIRTSSEEIMRLPLLSPGGSREDLKVCPEASALIGFWLNHGLAHPGTAPSNWARDPEQAHEYWGPLVRERIARQVNFIRHWKITCASYETIPQQRATWFVDPPYSSRAGRAYRFDAVDFTHLGKWCQQRDGQVIVCENDGAKWLPFERMGNFLATHRKHRARNVSAEAIWYRE